MLLVIDIGNTNIVVGLMDQDRHVVFSGRVSSNRDKTGESFAKELARLDEYAGPELSAVEGAIISSVVPEITGAAADGIRLYTGKEALIVSRELKTGLTIDMDHPDRVGIDLIVDAVAGCEEYEGHLAIFDLGTATTLSIVDKDKVYRGTLIIPGVAIANEALSERTSQLPKITLEEPRAFCAKNTLDSMQSGLIYGTAAMLDGLIARVEEEVGEKVTAVATGGISRLILPYCKREIHYDPHMLLKGLWYLYYKTV